jgi:cysteine synthase A
MPPPSERRPGVAELFDSILDTVGDTPTIRINNLKAAGSTIYVKAEFFNSCRLHPGIPERVE